ncbi:MAG: glucose-1-phosphate cytidylyltransferase [Candidatus Omnitrophica bacterium]|nr:glucose-1-phosphate cytidylyltransferase [Candidatus Omnitrophota bacterium]
MPKKVKNRSKVLILCGGQGTRMREETEYRPKPLVEIGGKPILWHIMKSFAHFGLDDFVLCLGYRGNMIKEYFLNYEAMNNNFTISLGRQSRVTYHDAHPEQDFRVTLVETGLETMTGGRVKRSEPYIDTDLFIVTYGDGVSDVDVQDLVRFHRSHGKMATVTIVKPVSRFGVVDLDSKGRIKHFAEKPQLDGWASAGFMVFNKNFFKYLGGDDCVLERDPLERLAREGELMAYRHEGFFYAMDTYREYNYLNELWTGGKAPWRIWN